MACNSLQWPEMACNSLQWPAMACNGLQWPAMACNGPKVCSVWQRTLLATFLKCSTHIQSRQILRQILHVLPKLWEPSPILRDTNSSQQSASPSPSLSARGMPVTAYGILTLGVVCTAWSIYVHTCRSESFVTVCI